MQNYIEVQDPIINGDQQSDIIRANKLAKIIINAMDNKGYTLQKSHTNFIGQVAKCLVNCGYEIVSKG